MVLVRFISVLLTFSFLGCAEMRVSPMKSETIRIFYYPFNLQTFRPITTENIEEEAWCRFSMSSDEPDAEALLGLLTQTVDGVFDSRVVRLKVAGHRQRDIYVDIDAGTLEQPSGKQANLTPDAFIRLKDLMERLAAKHECETG
jgi:hypothetical protein